MLIMLQTPPMECLFSIVVPVNVPIVPVSVHVVVVVMMVAACFNNKMNCLYADLYMYK